VLTVGENSTAAMPPDYFGEPVHCHRVDGLPGYGISGDEAVVVRRLHRADRHRAAAGRRWLAAGDDYSCTGYCGSLICGTTVCSTKMACHSIKISTVHSLRL
jgi:hypothetical protein